MVPLWTALVWIVAVLIPMLASWPGEDKLCLKKKKKFAWVTVLAICPLGNPGDTFEHGHALQAHMIGWESSSEKKEEIAYTSSNLSSAFCNEVTRFQEGKVLQSLCAAAPRRSGDPGSDSLDPWLQHSVSTSSQRLRLHFAKQSCNV